MCFYIIPPLLVVIRIYHDPGRYFLLAKPSSFEVHIARTVNVCLICPSPYPSACKATLALAQITRIAQYHTTHPGDDERAIPNHDPLGQILLARCRHHIRQAAHDRLPEQERVVQYAQPGDQSLLRPVFEFINRAVRMIAFSERKRRVGGKVEDFDLIRS